MPLSVSSNVRQLSDGNSTGTILGRSPTDLIGFYGVSAGVAQPSGAAEAALARGVSIGSVATFGTSQSLTSVGANSTIFGTLTGYVGTNTGTGMTWQIATTDMIVAVNKPTAQAGLGVGNAKVSGTNQVSVSLSNWTAATVTPTAGQNYGIVAIRGMTTLTAVLTPAVVAVSTTAEQLFTVTGARVGEVVIAQKPTLQSGLEIVGARVAANNQVGVTFGTCGATSVTPTAGETYTFFTTGGMDGHGNIVNVGANIGASGGPTGTAVSALNVTVTGLATTDAIMSVTKPTLQAGAAVMPSFVSGANALGLVFWENAATVTPTAGEVYNMTMWRPNPAAPCVVYTSPQTPASVAPNTTAEQTFTVTGVVSGSVVVVNKPTAQVGLGIVGARVSGTNVIAVNFCNATAATITPTAGESYLVANFQQAIPDAGNAFIFAASQQIYQNVILSNAIRSAMTGTGLIAGA